jgi:hypothetical protein
VSRALPVVAMRAAPDRPEGWDEEGWPASSLVIAATPGARILELGPDGWGERGWEELDVVQNWRAFLDAPQRYLRYVLD